MKITHISAACIKIETERTSILCDPWFTEGIYDGAWYKFPEVIKPIDEIGDVDAIYISHLHPDHFDPAFLNEYFSVYGVKKIITSNYDNNIIKKIASRYGLELDCRKCARIGDIDIHIFLQNYDMQDIDSAALFVNGNTAVLNMNDCLYDQIQYEEIKDFITSKKIELGLCALQYGPAGPFPHTYFELNSELKEISKQHASFYVNRFLETVEFFQPKYALPFASSYMLGGKLAKYNEYLSKIDPFDLSLLDSRIKPLKEPGGFIDLDKDMIVGLITKKINIEELSEKSEKIKFNKLDYEKEINIAPEKINWERLVRASFANAIRKRIKFKNWNIRVSGHNNMESVFLFDLIICSDDKSKIIINKKDDNEKKENKFDLELEIDYRYLFGLLSTHYQWNDAEIGSHMKARRPGKYDPDIIKFLNNFTLA
jgi:UDP-MurNAc hydroxylase